MSDARKISAALLCVCIGVPVLLLSATNLAYFSLEPGEVFTGYARSDLIYYSANAREVFENGNGLVYGDPFSASDETPRVFSHLQLLLLGWLFHATGIPLPLLWQAFQLIFGATMFVAFHRLLTCYFDGRVLGYAFLVGALGGGATSFYALHAMQTNDLGFLANFDLLVSGPAGPGWLPNVFQNAAFATEAFYHTLAFATFAAVLTGRFGWALAFVFLTWWSHPFTGVEVAAICGAFALCESLLLRERRTIQLTVGIALISAAFLAYYVLLLPAWSPEAADIMRRWREAALVFRFEDAPAMWGVFLVAIVFVAAPIWKLLELATDPRDRFLAIWMAVVAALLLHDRLLPADVLPYQPIHFSHGYFFVPLAILTLRGLASISEDWTPKTRNALAVAFLVFVAIDNVAFTLNLATSQRRPVLTKDQAAVMRHLEESEPALVLLGRGVTVPEFLPVATHHRLYNFSRLQTPYFEAKSEAANRMLLHASPANAAALLGIGIVVGERNLTSRFADDVENGRARIAFEAGPYTVIEIAAPPVPQRPEAATELPAPPRASLSAPRR